MQRADILASVASAQQPFDMVVIGGGANGAGIALDAASRGLRVVLCERAAFGNGTSSRSSKLIHGGIRYLALGQFSLVREALAERALLLRNAVGLVEPLEFVVPAQNHIDLVKFAAGTALYDLMAGRRRVHSSRILNRARTLSMIPQLDGSKLVGAVRYGDARFDDTRLLLAVLTRAASCGAQVLNYCEVTGFGYSARNRIRTVRVRDHMLDHEFEIAAKVVVNATGVFGDRVRALATDPRPGGVLPSQGAHIVLPREFMPIDRAVVLPRTPDGRIMFMVPWYGHVLLGTTDTALDQITDSPRPLPIELDMLLDVAARFLVRRPSHADIVSTFAGIRPLAAAPVARDTSKVSREHVIDIGPSGLISVSGGKWTTFRRVAEQCVDQAISRAGLRAGHSVTCDLTLCARPSAPPAEIDLAGFPAHGLAQLIEGEPNLAERLHPALPYCGAHFAWAARAEMALTVADALAFHTRALFINAQAAMEIAPRVASIMASVLKRQADWVEREITSACDVAHGFRSTRQ
jgi:glycerol-3-phosphate dehydrogenase